MAKKQNVQEMLASLAQAQNDFQRDQSRRNWVNEFMKDPKSALEVAEHKTRSLFPGKAKATMQDAFGVVVGDASIPGKKLEETKAKIAREVFNKWRSEQEHISYALDATRRELGESANPFKDPHYETLRANYMQELNLIGAPRTKAEVVDTLTAVARGRDIGAVIFWNRVGRRMFERAEGDNSQLEVFQGLMGQLEDGINEVRSVEQRIAAQKLKDLEDGAAELEKALDTARFIDENDVIGVEMRERTEVEQRHAELNEKARELQAAQEKAIADARNRWVVPETV